jgi:hypothetical protein
LKEKIKLHQYQSMEAPTPKPVILLEVHRQRNQLLLMIMLLGVHWKRNQLLLLIMLLAVHRRRNQLLQLTVMR